MEGTLIGPGGGYPPKNFFGGIWGLIFFKKKSGSGKLCKKGFVGDSQKSSKYTGKFNQILKRSFSFKEKKRKNFEKKIFWFFSSLPIFDRGPKNWIFLFPPKKIFAFSKRFKSTGGGFKKNFCFLSYLNFNLRGGGDGKFLIVIFNQKKFFKNHFHKEKDGLFLQGRFFLGPLQK